MVRKTAKIVATSGLVLALAACGGVKDANKSNFSKAIQTWLDTQPGLCVDIPGSKMPLIVEKNSLFPSDKVQANALVDAGLLNKKDTEIKGQTFGGQYKMFPATEYQTTDEGKKYFVASKPGYIRNKFCSGKYIMVGVDNFTEPSNMWGTTMSQVKFHYKVQGSADWAKSASLHAAYSELDKQIQGDIEDKAVLVLTDNGWVHEKLFNKD